MSKTVAGVTIKTEVAMGPLAWANLIWQFGEKERLALLHYLVNEILMSKDEEPEESSREITVRLQAAEGSLAEFKMEPEEIEEGMVIRLKT